MITFVWTVSSFSKTVEFEAVTWEQAKAEAMRLLDISELGWALANISYRTVKGG
jgi:hypothetical protein